MKPLLIKLLLVDDIQANLLALEQLLEAPDRELIRANSGEEALEILLKEQNFAVILMDVQMPGLDGFDAVSLLKAKDNCQDIPIIFLTAFDKEGAMEIEAYATGAVDYVMKPIQPQILISKVDVFVDLYKGRQLLQQKNNALEQANIKLTREISLRERAEAQLRLADQAINDTHESVIIANIHGLIERVNPAFCQLSGYTNHELIQRNVVTLSCEDISQVEHALVFASLHDQGSWIGELRCKKKDGTIYSTWAHISGIYNKKKILIHYCAILSEVNDPQRAELVLRKVKLRLEQAQHISHLGAWEWNRSESEIYCSNELFHILDTSPDQISPSIKICRQFIHPDDASKFDRMIETIQSGQSSDIILRLLLPDDRERIVHAQTDVRCNTQGDLLQLIGTVHDITEHAKLEESFMQAQKMEAIGALVGGIAHEFNNILAGMNGHMYLAKCNAGNNSDVLDHISQLELLSARAAETIQQMLTFSRKGLVSMKNITLNQLIHETLKLHKTSVPEHISLDHAICNETLNINGDNNLIQQLLLNLILNARDALTAARTPSIMIRLQSNHADAAFLSAHPDAEAGTAYAQITVSDNGCGIDANAIDKVFEPFFTSKGDQGTGLGLSMVYGAVKSHHGFIKLDSQPGKGSAFHVFLPLLTEHPKAKEAIATDSMIKGHGEVVLVADDEEIVRDMTRDTLEMLGYHVITAKDGQQALDIFSERRAEISLVILDVIMPKLGGVDAASAMRGIQSDAAILFITGYNEDRSLGNWIAAGETMIMKPFTIHEFSQRVAQTL